eukprot:1152698-Pelagomonas_calceolata.AAC.2
MSPYTASWMPAVGDLMLDFLQHRDRFNLCIHLLVMVRHKPIRFGPFHDEGTLVKETQLAYRNHAMFSDKEHNKIH